MPRTRSGYLSLLLALCALLVLTSPVAAGRRWCAKDPLFKINGQVVDVRLASYPSLEHKATGKTQLVLTVPVGVTAGVYAMDSGYGRFGYDIVIRTAPGLQVSATAVEIRVEAWVPSSDDTLPLVVTVVPRSVGHAPSLAAAGFVNRWVVATNAAVL